MRAPQPTRPWTDSDQALLYTCFLLDELIRTGQAHPHPVATTFTHVLEAGEQILAQDGFLLLAPVTPTALSPIDNGLVTVSSRGFYLQSTLGLRRWRYSSIDSIQVEQFNMMAMIGRSEAGQVSWIIQSRYAELIFALWALAEHPEHPQLVGAQFLPPGWVPWARAVQPQPVVVPMLPRG